MKKNRNSFFTEANMSYSGYNPNVNPNMNMTPNMPYQAQSSYNYYAGMMPNQQYSNPTDTIDSRLAKMERQINRLEHRVSKLESLNTTCITEEDNSSNMYMI